MDNRMKRTIIGSRTAKGGFSNEKAICQKFNNWKSDKEAKKLAGENGKLIVILNNDKQAILKKGFVSCLVGSGISWQFFSKPFSRFFYTFMPFLNYDGLRLQ